LTFDPVRICTILNEEGVDDEVVGGFAAVVHGGSLPTRDVAALDDIIDSKRAANRLKDQRALPYLESLRDQLR
jgi:hypothetical protein